MFRQPDPLPPQLFSGNDEAFYQKLSRLDEVVAEGSAAPSGDALVSVPVSPHSAGAQILLTMRDITDRKLEELEHRHLAWHDSLTGLLNRYGLMKSLEAYCGLGGRFALVFMDLDNFKLVNDNYGHKAGDRLLGGLPAGSSRSVRAMSWPGSVATNSLPWCR